jgi:hypothetical protein
MAALTEKVSKSKNYRPIKKLGFEASTTINVCKGSNVSTNR